MRDFTDHKWRIEIECGMVKMHVPYEDMCPEPSHGPDCAYMKYVDAKMENKAHVQISDDMGIRYLGSLSAADLLTAPSCDCGAAKEYCHWCYDGAATELVVASLKVTKASYHYSFDAYSKEAEAWIDIEGVEVDD